MNALKKCLTAAAILSLCTFGACKKKDEQHPAQQQQATEAAHALLQVSREIAEQTATVAIEEYIPADAVVAVVSSPDINISEIPVVAMFKDEDLKPEGVTQIGFFMKPDYTVAIVSFESADKAQNIISKNAAKPESQTRTAGHSNPTIKHQASIAPTMPKAFRCSSTLAPQSTIKQSMRSSTNPQPNTPSAR